MRYVILALCCLSFIGDPCLGSENRGSKRQARKAEAMTNADVIQLVKADLSSDVIITSIRQARSRNFDLTSAGLIALKKARVPDLVILAMQNPGTHSDQGTKAKGSNSLSRQRAAELISRQQHLPTAIITTFGTYSNKAWSNPSRFPAACVVNEQSDTYASMKERLEDWRTKGLITLGETQTHQGECNYSWWTTDVTSKGSPYVLRAERTGAFGSFDVRIYDLAFGEVTGIQVNEQFKFAEADYTLKAMNITPFATELPTQPITRKAHFRLFDDGWRIGE